jgi:hypothetical protein
MGIDALRIADDIGWMRAIIVTAVLALISAPALAADCTYVSESGDRLAFVDDGENTVQITEASGEVVQCSWAVTPDGPDTQDIACEGGLRDGFFFGSATPNSDTRDFMIFDEDVWYADCTN